MQLLLLTARSGLRPLLTDHSVSWQGVGMAEVNRMLEDDAASRAMGIEVTDAVDGNATARMRVRKDMVNGHGIAHGAFVFAVADTAFACACNSHGPVTVAAAAEITFVAP